MKREHTYTHKLKWEGDSSISTIQNDRFYSINIEGKQIIKGSADKVFHGDAMLYNPEDMLLAALSSCHMMSFFYICRKKGYEIKSYLDNPVGVLKLNSNGSGQFKKVVLFPEVIFSINSNQIPLLELHKEAGSLCFIANSCSFEIEYSPK